MVRAPFSKYLTFYVEYFEKKGNGGSNPPRLTHYSPLPLPINYHIRTDTAI